MKDKALEIILASKEQGDSAILYEHLRMSIIQQHISVVSQYVDGIGFSTKEDAINSLEAIVYMAVVDGRLPNSPIIFTKGGTFSLCFDGGAISMINVDTKEVFLATEAETNQMERKEAHDYVRSLIPISKFGDDDNA